MYICVHMHIYVCVYSVTQSCSTLCDMWTVAHQAPLSMELQARILQWIAIFLLQRIFLTRGSNQHLLCLLHYQADSLPVVAWESPYICIYVCIYNVYWMALCIYNLEYLKICLTVVTQVYAVSSIFLKHSLANLLCEN